MAVYLIVYNITCYAQVSDTKPAGQKPVSAHTDSSSRQAREGKEKPPSHHRAVAQERICAKLIAISEQSAAEVKKSLTVQPRDTSSHARSPSPKRRTHVRMTMTVTKQE